MGTMADVVERETFKPTFQKLESSIQISLGVVMTVLGLIGIAFGIWSFLKKKQFIKLLDNRFTVKAIIPGHYILAFVPVGYGMVMILMFGLDFWGGWLACLSVPAVLLFFILSTKNNR
jgi:hypothetical protein